MAEYGIKQTWPDLITDTSTSAQNGLGVIRFEGAKAYRYVNVVDVACTLGDVLTQASTAEGYVTIDISGGSSVAIFARGVAIGTIASGSYGWIQCQGVGTVQCDGSVAAGNALVPHASENGHADTVTAGTTDAQVFGYATAADAGSSSGDTALCYINCS